MNKLFRLIIILVIVSGFLFGFYYLFMRPVGYTSQVDLVNGYLSDLNVENCETHFIDETQDVCSEFVSLFDEVDFSLGDLVATNNLVEVTIIVGDNEDVFIFHIVSLEPGGLRGILTKEYYLIDYIE